VLTADFDTFFERPTAVLVGTRDAALIPETLRAYGARRLSEAELRVYVRRELAALTLANLRDNGEIAVNVAHPETFEAYQVKGRFLRERALDEEDERLWSEQRELFRRAQRELMGLSEEAIENMRWAPDMAIDLDARTVFVQTPGPGAGRPREAPE
jgi:hypothetical protein